MTVKGTYANDNSIDSIIGVKNQVSDNTVLAGLWISSVIGAAMTILFCFLQRTSQLYRYRLVAGKVRVRPPKLRQHGLISLIDWAIKSVSVSDVKFIQSAGLDALIMVKICSLGVQLFLPLCILGVAVLIPLHWSGGASRRLDAYQSGFMRLTMSNIPQGSPVFWVHVVFVYLYLGYAMALLRWHYHQYLTIRQYYLRKGDDINVWRALYDQRDGAGHQRPAGGAESALGNLLRSVPLIKALLPSGVPTAGSGADAPAEVSGGECEDELCPLPFQVAAAAAGGSGGGGPSALQRRRSELLGPGASPAGSRSGPGGAEVRQRRGFRHSETLHRRSETLHRHFGGGRGAPLGGADEEPQPSQSLERRSLPPAVRSQQHRGDAEAADGGGNGGGRDGVGEGRCCGLTRQGGYSLATAAPAGGHGGDSPRPQRSRSVLSYSRTSSQRQVSLPLCAEPADTPVPGIPAAAALGADHPAAPAVQDVLRGARAGDAGDGVEARHLRDGGGAGAGDIAVCGGGIAVPVAEAREQDAALPERDGRGDPAAVTTAAERAAAAMEFPRRQQPAEAEAEIAGSGGAAEIAEVRLQLYVSDGGGAAADAISGVLARVPSSGWPGGGICGSDGRMSPPDAPAMSRLRRRPRRSGSGGDGGGSSRGPSRCGSGATAAAAGALDPDAALLRWWRERPVKSVGPPRSPLQARRSQSVQVLVLPGKAAAASGGSDRGLGSGEATAAATSGRSLASTEGGDAQEDAQEDGAEEEEEEVVGGVDLARPSVGHRKTVNAEYPDGRRLAVLAQHYAVLVTDVAEPGTSREGQGHGEDGPASGRSPNRYPAAGGGGKKSATTDAGAAAKTPGGNAGSLQGSASRAPPRRLAKLLPQWLRSWCNLQYGSQAARKLDPTLRAALSLEELPTGPTEAVAGSSLAARSLHASSFASNNAAAAPVTAAQFGLPRGSVDSRTLLAPTLQAAIQHRVRGTVDPPTPQRSFSGLRDGGGGDAAAAAAAPDAGGGRTAAVRQPALMSRGPHGRSSDAGDKLIRVLEMMAREAMAKLAAMHLEPSAPEAANTVQPPLAPRAATLPSRMAAAASTADLSSVRGRHSAGSGGQQQQQQDGLAAAVAVARSAGGGSDGAPYEERQTAGGSGRAESIAFVVMPRQAEAPSRSVEEAPAAAAAPPPKPPRPPLRAFPGAGPVAEGLEKGQGGGDGDGDGLADAGRDDDGAAVAAAAAAADADADATSRCPAEVCNGGGGGDGADGGGAKQRGDLEPDGDGSSAGGGSAAAASGACRNGSELWAMARAAVWGGRVAQLPWRSRYSLVTSTFLRLFPEEFDRAIPVINFKEVDLLLMRVDKHMAQYEYAVKYEEKTGKPLFGRTGCCGLVGERRRLLDFHRQRINDLLSEVRAARRRAFDSASTPSWFVFFRTQRAAAMASQCLIHAEDNRQFRVHPAPGPDEVNWSALWSGFQARDLRRNLMRPLVALLVAFPVGIFTGALTQLDYLLCPSHTCVNLAEGSVEWTAAGCTDDISRRERLSQQLSWAWYCEQADPVARLLKRLVVAWLPSLLLVLWQGMVLPLVFTFAVQIGREARSLSEADRCIAKKMFYFAVFNVFLGGVAGSTIIQGINSAIEKGPGEIFNLVGTYVPTSSNFFINYTMFRAFVAVPLRMLWPHIGIRMYLIRRYLRVSRIITPRESALLMAPVSPRYGFEVGMIMIIFLIGFAFSVVSPLLLVMALLFFAISWLFWRWALLYVYVRKYEGGGTMWPFIFNRVMVCMAIFMVFTCCVLITKHAYAQAILLLLTVPVALIRFNKYCYYRFETGLQALPLEATVTAPRARVEPWVYTPPPLLPNLAGWHPDWAKCWMGWNAPVVYG